MANLYEAFGVNRDMDHDELYGQIVKSLGFDNVRRCIPFSSEELKEAYEKDKHFNSIPIKIWDSLAGFTCTTNQRTGAEDIRKFNNTFTDLLNKTGATSWAPAQAVCILKRCAKMCVEG